jgi:hypothetical protein
MQLRIWFSLSICVRYIDDFILLGATQASVGAAYRSARALLNKMGMNVYDPSDEKARRDGKVDCGSIYNGTDVLGYRVSGTARQPCAAAVKKFLEKIDLVLVSAKKEMAAAAKGTSSSHQSRYHQSMVQLHKIIWGWSQSFRHSTTTHVFEQLDRDVDKRIAALWDQANRLIPEDDFRTHRRVMGIHLLGDTKATDLPSVDMVF